MCVKYIKVFKERNKKQYITLTLPLQNTLDFNGAVLFYTMTHFCDLLICYQLKNNTIL